MNVVIVAPTFQQLQFILDSISLETVKVSRIVLADGPFAESFDLGFKGRHYQGSSYEYLEEVAVSAQYDYFLVCNHESSTLLGEIGIPASKILNFSILFFPMQFSEKARLLHRVRQSAPQNQFKLFVTGLSYAYHGTDLSSYSLPAVNLAGISQDLYYDFCMAKQVLQIPELDFSYALIGLAPYSFHSELSKSAENWRIPAYALALGDTHHYPLDSVHWHQMMFPLIERESKRIEMETEPFSFNDPIGLCAQLDYKMGSKQRLGARKRADIWKKKRFPNTVKENKIILRQYIHLCRTKNVKPILVIFPVTNIYRQFFSKQLLEEFYTDIEKIRDEEAVTILDYFADDHFSQQDFCDIDHLNRTGARKVSAMINESIKDAS